VDAGVTMGLMNRAHAYKAAADLNLEQGEDVDAGVTMGLFSYPILMAADILMFNAHLVPVGRDQIQHIEMARDVAQRFNHTFGAGRELFVLPEALIEESVALLPGLDGRKMSKSYDNVIPLFEGGAKGLREAVARIVTDSRLPGEPKDPGASHLVTLYDAFATPGQAKTFRAALVDGLGWGDAKQQLVDLIDAEMGPKRERYEHLMAHPEQLEEILQEGARKARASATPFLQTLREAVGLRRMNAIAVPQAHKTGKVALPVIKQYRETDGLFYFKLTDPQGRTLVQGPGFDQGKACGQLVAQFKAAQAGQWQSLGLRAAEGVVDQEVDASLDALRAAQEAKDAAKA
jgi:tryptophanyl-tRNA synthetase